MENFLFIILGVCAVLLILANHMLAILFYGACTILGALAASITGNYWLFLGAVCTYAALWARLSDAADEKEIPWALR
jgi:hypothetical protein